MLQTRSSSKSNTKTNSYISTKLMEVGVSGIIFLKCWRGAKKPCQPKVLYSEKKSFKNYDKLKTFSEN